MTAYQETAKAGRKPPLYVGSKSKRTQLHPLYPYWNAKQHKDHKDATDAESSCMRGKPNGSSRIKLPLSAIPSFVLEKSKTQGNNKEKRIKTKEINKKKRPNKKQSRNAVGCNHPAIFFFGFSWPLILIFTPDKMKMNCINWSSMRGSNNLLPHQQDYKNILASNCIF